MACRLFSDNPLPEPMMFYFQLDPIEHMFQWNCVSNSKVFIQENAYENVVCQIGSHPVSASIC